MKRLIKNKYFISITFSIFALLISIPIILLMILALIKYVWG